MLDAQKIEDRVWSLLEDWGYSVRRIKTAPRSRRADFLLTRDEEKIVVEVTSKSDDGEYDRSLRTLGQAFHEGRISRTGTVARVLHGKNDQLRSTPEAGDAIRIVWLEAIGPFAEMIAQQIEATFYGRVSVPVSEGDETIERHCYFFDHAACYSLRFIDAIVVSLGGGGRFLINPNSDGDLDGTYKTYLARWFENAGALISPLEQEEAGIAFSAHDFQGDRRDEQMKCAFLEQKYGIKPFIPIRWNALRAAKQVSGLATSQ